MRKVWYTYKDDSYGESHDNRTDDEFSSLREPARHGLEFFLNRFVCVWGLINDVRKKRFLEPRPGIEPGTYSFLAFDTRLSLHH